MKKNLYKLNTIRNNLLLLPSLFFLFLTVVMIICSYCIFYNFLYKERIEQIKYVIDSVGVEFAHKQEHVENGERTRAEAEQEMIETISRVHFGNNSYLWVIDRDGTLKYHPNSKLIGTNVTEHIDKNGVYFGQKMYEIIKHNGSGFVAYSWSKPGSTKQYSKVSYTKMFKDFGWALSAGIYIDDIQNKAIFSLLTTFIPVLLLLLLFRMQLGKIILKKIIIPLEKITQTSNKIAKGDYSLDLPNTQGELVEIAALSEAFRQFVFLAQKDKNNENKISTILNNISDGLLILDDAFFIESCNIAAQNMFNYQEKELVGEDIKMLIPFIVFDYLELNTNLYGHRKDDEEIFPVDVLINTIYFEGKKLYILILRDITKEKEIEKTKNEFISIISHELRTPLTSIRGSLGLIISGMLGAIPQKALDLANVANNNCIRLVNLINDILDIEKIKAGKMTFDIREYEIVSIVQEALNLNESYAKQFNIKFELKEKIDAAYVNIDRDRIIQVLTNLLSNATKFSKENGVVNVYIKQKNESVLICVEDFGSGIPLEFRSKIFQSFSQADSSDTRKRGGSGLGLAICKEIVEKLNGKISFDSQEGVGTTFYMELPEVIKQDGETMSVLICEDCKTSAASLKLLFEKLKYNADIAYSIEQAKGFLEKKQYELMTLDIMFPDGNGLDLLKEIRESEIHKDLPVIVISASEEKIVEYQITKWIDKSFNFEDLKKIINNLLKEKRASKYNILHVDDESDILDITELTLKNIANVAKANTIASAIEFINTDSFDLFILDYKLPDGDCLDLIEKIRASRNQNAKIVIFSAYDIEKEIYKKVDVVFLKTFISSAKLAQSVEELLRGGK